MLPDIDRRELYMEYVAKRMTSLGTVKVVNREEDKFRLQCYVYQGGTLEQAKEGVTKFLVEAWGAYAIEFWKPKHAVNREFYCYFHTPAF